jgi:imidazolonepropionase-like amidohydrolase
MSASTRSDGCEEERLAGLDRAHQHYTNTLAHAHCINALEDISKKALRAQNHGSMADALLAINETAQKGPTEARRGHEGPLPHATPRGARHGCGL